MPYAAARRDFMLGAFPAKLRQCRAQGTHTLHVAQRKPDPVQCLSDQHSELVSIDEISEQEIDATVSPTGIARMVCCGYANRCHKSAKVYIRYMHILYMHIRVTVSAPSHCVAQADLLATAFSEAINRINYKRFLEKEIRQYLLTSTTDLSDDCIIFVAKARQTGAGLPAEMPYRVED